MTAAPRTHAEGALRRRRPRPWQVYLALLIASHFVQTVRAPSADRPGKEAPAEGQTLVASVPAMAPDGPTGAQLEISYRYWPAPASGEPRTVLLLHGSPGQGADFDRLGPRLRDAGYTVIAPDMPGFGRSARVPPSMSSLAHARGVLAMLDGLGVERAHVVGWSLGGAVAMYLADLDPGRIASLTLMAAVSEQDAEGSGSYFFEHAKYAAGYAVAAGFRHLTPHFGLLSGLEVAQASMRNFWDTDMRPLRGIMQRLEIPTLVLHGRHDFLVPDWAAERSYDLIKTGSLVVLDASHFLPLAQPEEAAAHLLPFFARHDQPGVPALRQIADLAPVRGMILGQWGEGAALTIRDLPWFVIIALLAVAVAGRNRLGAVAAALLVSFGIIDFGVGLGGVLLGLWLAAAGPYLRGRAMRQRGERPRVIGVGILARTPEGWARRLRQQPVRTAISTRFVPEEHGAAMEAAGYGGGAPAAFFGAAAAGWALWGVYYVVFTLIASVWIMHPLAERWGFWGLAAAVGIAVVLPRPLELAFTGQGRRVLRIRLERAARLEYWPTWALYVPLAPLYVYWGLRYGPIVFTCCNPAIGGGGGVIGESKKSTLDALDQPGSVVLPAELIEAGSDPESRAAAAIRAIRTRPQLGGFPIILKPDNGFRGFSVKLARNEDDVRAYFLGMHGPAVVQAYHPGPHECGILWARRPRAMGEPESGGRAGFIFSITRKEFPVLVGDGRRTLEALIYAHPRFRRQAGVFLERFAAERERVLAAGQTLRLAQSGNHCQGTLFRDGADLITPALEARIDQIARGFSSGLDMGRFDVRFASEDALRAGEGFAIIELNGTTGESTNIYDPQRPIPWAYGVLAAQWKLLYRLGAARRDGGARPLGVLRLFVELGRHYRTRTGSALAD